MITIYTITYNEELLIPFMIEHYRERFPDCHIVVYDNRSTDNTVKIALDNRCEVIYYDSGGTLNDLLHRNIKNNCWKNARTDWILTCDLDEFLDINKSQLLDEQKRGSTIIKAEGWTMVNLEDNDDVRNIKHGYRTIDEILYDKCMLFNKKFIKEMNYGVGAHNCFPVGAVKYGNTYKMYHYKFINPDREVKKRQETFKRLSEVNKKYGCGVAQCSMSEEEIRRDFQGRRSIGKIRD